MQAQSRLSVRGLDSAEEHEAVVRELARGHELTERLQEEALRALRGQGQAEVTAASILGKMSRAFTLCISIMGGFASPAAAPARADTPGSSVSVGARRARDDGIPRKQTLTSSPDSDGYQWRKYGQKRIMNTTFPRCYYRCGNHRGRNCPATKQVQRQHSNSDPPLFLVIYVREHTCHTPPPAEPEASPRSCTTTNPLVGFSGGRLSQQGAGALDRGAKEEHERRALVSSLTCVLQGQHSAGGGALEGPSSQGPRAGDGGASASAPSISAGASELPVVRLDADEALDVMDYDVTDTVYFGASASYGLPDDGMLF